MLILVKNENELIDSCDYFCEILFYVFGESW